MCIYNQGTQKGCEKYLDVSDITILKEYKKNSRRGLELVYDRYKKYVYTIAFHYAGNKEDALDITQEVFIAVFKSMDGFKEQFSILPWIKKITVNKSLNFLRSKKQNLSLNETNENGDELQGIISSNETTDGTVLYKDTRQILQQSIGRLPEKERMVLVLRHVKQMKYSEIATVMKLPPGTVKTLIHRARKTIKENMVSLGIWEV